MSKPATPTFDRLNRRTEMLDDGCIVFTGPLDKQGYGRILHRGEKRLVHRVSYEIFVGEIPDGLQVHHTCENRACVNPAHLVTVTPKAHSAEHLRTHCIHGHEFNERNTRLTHGGTARACRRCDADRAAQYREQKAAA